ncbi:MAG: XRE family transcriptional regulator, partial [Chloroflexi bacterium]
LGMGGIGKSALVVRTMQQLAERFQVVLFRSLRDAPSCESLLDSCLQVLSPESLVRESQGLSARLRLLSEQLRSTRVLLVLDNLESLLQAGEVRGRLRPGFEAYGHLLRQVAQSGHHSCLLLTSREKPTALPGLEGRKTPVRALRLDGLEASACEQLLAEHELVGFPEERARLIERYGGNPLALNIVAQTIADLFGGEISPFLEADTAIFGGIAELLSEQWGRLSSLEQRLLCWLAILREPVTLDELQAVLVAPLAQVQVLEAVDGLHRRSLLERGQRPGSFTLQSVVLEYVTGRLVSTASEEIRQGRLSLLLSHGLSQAQVKDYVRQAQERLLVVPLLARLQSTEPGHVEVEQRLRSLLEEVRRWAQDRQGYAPANLLTLLRVLRGHLRGLDLSRLVLRGVHLQGVEMQDASLSGALLQESVFTETFDAITAVATSPDGQYWAAAGRRGEVRVWREAGPTLHLAWQGHTDTVLSIAFSPDGRLLASGSTDGSVKLWDVESNALLWSGWQTKSTLCLAFSPEGDLLASGGNDARVHLWDLHSGTPLQTLPHPSPIFSVAWSPDGRLLASGDIEGGIRLWELQKTHPATCLARLSGHTNRVRGLAFAPDGSLLVSASWDRTVKLWEVGEMGSLRLHQTLTGHTDNIFSVAFSPDGSMLASGSNDAAVRLWDPLSGRQLETLSHPDPVFAVSWSPDGHLLASGGFDGHIRVWEMQKTQPARCVQTLEGHSNRVRGLAFAPDGSVLASASWDGTVKLWEVGETGSRRCLQTLVGHTDKVHCVAWSPDGGTLASGSFDHTIWLWDGKAGSARAALLGHSAVVYAAWIRRVAWSPDGMRLASGGVDGSVCLWQACDGTRLHRLQGHRGIAASVAWSSDGTRLASCGGGRGSGEIFVWQAHSEERLYALEGLVEIISTVAWYPVGDRLISGGSDGRLRWWDLQHGECVWVREAHQGTVQALKVSPDGSMLASCGDDGAIKIWDLERGEHLHTLRRDRPYERLNITGIRGLTQAEIATLGAVEDEASNSSEHAAQR